MKSTFTRILLLFVAGWLFCTLLMFGTSWIVSQTIRRDDPFSRSLALQLENLRRTYERDGTAGVQREFRRIDEFFLPSASSWMGQIAML